MYEKRGSGGKCLSCKIQTTTFERSGAPKFSFTFDGGRLTWAINSIGYGQGEKSSSKNVQQSFANISVHGCHCITAPKHCTLAALSRAMERGRKKGKVARCLKLQISTRYLHRCMLAVHMHIFSWCLFAIMFLPLQFSPLDLCQSALTQRSFGSDRNTAERNEKKVGPTKRSEEKKCSTLLTSGGAKCMGSLTVHQLS